MDTVVYFVPKSLYGTMILQNVREGPSARGSLTYNPKFRLRNQAKIPDELSDKMARNCNPKDKVQQSDKLEMLQDLGL